LLQQAEKAVRRPVRRPKHLIREGGET
jgi:hypothetical protein